MQKQPSKQTKPRAARKPKTPVSPEEALANAARVAVRDSLKIQSGERVLIITNPADEVSRVSWALHDAAAKAGARVVLVYQPVKTQFDFCSEEVTAALKTAPQVVMSISAERLGKDAEAIQKPYTDGGRSYDSVFHYLMYGKKCTRAFWSPRVTVDSFIRAVPVDYARMKLECRRLKEILDGAEALRVTNKNGTDITFSVAGRTAFTDDGDFSAPGSGGNLPAGETFISPALGSAEGRIVFDGSICGRKGEILIKTPITVHVSGGFACQIEGNDEARELQATIRMGEENARVMREEGKLSEDSAKAYIRNARNIGELGIGLNPSAKITGNMLEDEKVFRTCHFAIGSNYDDDAPALIHLDGLVSLPTITAAFPDGRVRDVIRNGEPASF